VAERGGGEEPEEEVGGYVAWTVLPEDDHHGPVDHGAERGAVV
jgi:hypothetical protein